MRRLLVVLAVTLVSTTLLAQRRPGRMPISDGAPAAEGAVKQSMGRVVAEKKAMDRDLQILTHIRAGDRALTDPMQPTVALEKAHEEISEAGRLNVDFFVGQGLSRVRRGLEDARRSPATADFGRLRSLVQEQALGPSSRLVVRNATRLQEEMLAWIQVQELIALHLKNLAEITGESLRASDEE
ncbi:MAG TPA: hypothetical protein VFP80_01615 [Thermoanaerobaculia bacterium]|nr:hypothetical protein [Thermoanaerobaculia bacterium]